LRIKDRNKTAYAECREELEKMKSEWAKAINDFGAMVRAEAHPQEFICKADMYLSFPEKLRTMKFNKYDAYLAKVKAFQHTAAVNYDRDLANARMDIT